MTPDELRALLGKATAAPWSSHNSMGTGYLRSSAQDVALIVALRNHAEALLELWEASRLRMETWLATEEVEAYRRIAVALDRLAAT